MSLSLVSYDDSDSDNESKDASSTKPESDVRKLLVVPSRRGPVKQKGPVKIGLPTFNKGVSIYMVDAVHLINNVVGRLRF